MIAPASRRRLALSIRYTILAALLVADLFPVYWVLSMSLKPARQVFSYPPVFLYHPTLENYQTVLFGTDFSRLTFNSAIAALGSTALALGIGSPAAWGISRHQIGGRTFLMALLSIKLIPVITIVIPVFLLFVKVRLVDTYVTLPLAYLVINLPFAIWMMKAFIDDIPSEIEESVILDGGTTLTLLSRIVVPLAMPGLIATSIFCFIFAWNEFVLAVVLTRVTARTAMVGLATFVSEEAIHWGAMSAAGIVVMLPPILLALALQKYLVRGLTAGALK